MNEKRAFLKRSFLVKFSRCESEVIFDSEVVLRTVKFFAVQKGWLYFNNPITLP